MRAKPILVAALLAGISVACSKPAPQAPGEGSPADGREILLVDAPSADLPVVSALEAGRDSTLDQASSTYHTPATSGPAARTSIPAPDREPSAGVAVASLAVTEMAAPAALAPATTSLPLRFPRTEMPALTRSPAVPEPAGGGRGPVILIRGGMGTPHDDCKLHPVASRGVGIAINNVAPPIPGRVAVNTRFSGGNGGFTRIR